MKVQDIIKQALVTEKSATQQEKGQYSFVVNLNASKIDIKNAVRSLYGVEVKDVKVSILPGKIRLVGRAKMLTKRSKTKKATVTLKDGKTLDLNNFKETKSTK